MNPTPRPLANDIFLRALRRETVPHTPVWLMRQAGRYLPEYNATRARAGSFLALAQDARARDRGDAAAAGALSARRGDPVLGHPDRSRRDGPRASTSPRARARASSARSRDEASIAALAVPDMARAALRVRRGRVDQRALAGRVPLIGFSGSPFTLACYMIEGGGSARLRARCGSMAYARPDLLQRIVDVNAEAVARTSTSRSPPAPTP